MHLLADEVVHRTKDANCTSRQSNELPGQPALRVLPISTEAETGSNESGDSSVGKKDGVAGVSTDAAGLSLAGLGLLLSILACALLLLLFGFALYPLSLSGSLDILLEELRLHRLHVRSVDIDQRSCALGFVLVDSSNVRSTTEVCVSWQGPLDLW